MRQLSIVLGLASLAACLAAPVLFFVGSLSEGAFKTTFLAASMSWFVFGALWASRRAA